MLEKAVQSAIYEKALALHYSQKRDEELTKALETPYHRSSQFQL